MMDDVPLSLHERNKLATTDEEIWLLGQPPLSDYLSYVRHWVVGGENLDPRALCDEWREANDYYYELEQKEAGIADQVECRDLDPALAPLAEQVMATPRFRRAFDRLPTRFAMVELDRLVTFQPHVTCRFVDSLKSRLGPAPGPEDLFRFCLPLERPEASVQVRRAGSRRYIFTCDSNDLRFLEPMLLGAERIRDFASFGPVGSVVALVVGFGSNFLNAISADNRLILHNGYHRAYTMRAMGITHAPCIIQTVTRRDELALTAAEAVNETPAFYLKAARPPLLKDFFDPRIRKVLPVHRARKMVEVSYEIREFDIVE
jgi:hypothetical protein